MSFLWYKLPCNPVTRLLGPLSAAFFALRCCFCCALAPFSQEGKGSYAECRVSLTFPMLS